MTRSRRRGSRRRFARCSSADRGERPRILQPCAGIDPRSNQTFSPRNSRVAGSHGKRISTSRAIGSPDADTPRPRPEVRAGEPGGLEHSLRPNDDVGQLEAVIRKGREKLGVEGARAVVPVPALAGRDQLVRAVRREGCYERVDVAGVLGDRVADPESLDLAQLGGVEPPREERTRGRPGRHSAACAAFCRARCRAALARLPQLAMSHQRRWPARDSS
jgi:hypothetical protein